MIDTLKRFLIIIWIMPEIIRALYVCIYNQLMSFKHYMIANFVCILIFFIIEKYYGEISDYLNNFCIL